MLQINSIILNLAILVVGLTAATPINDVKIDSYNYKSLDDQNGYKFNFKLSDGQDRTEEGNFKTLANGDQYLVVSGSYKYIGPDNVEYTVIYTADENGFHPYSVNIPQSGFSTTTPPIDLSEVIADLAPNAIKSLIG